MQNTIKIRLPNPVPKEQPQSLVATVAGSFPRLQTAKMPKFGGPSKQRPLQHEFKLEESWNDWLQTTKETCPCPLLFLLQSKTNLAKANPLITTHPFHRHERVPPHSQNSQRARCLEILLHASTFLPRLLIGLTMTEVAGSKTPRVLASPAKKVSSICQSSLRP